MEAPLVGVCDFHWLICMFVCETSTHVFCVGVEFSHPGWKVQRQHAPRIPSVLRLLRDWATTATMGPQMTAISGAFHGENITRVTKDTIQDSSKIRIDISYQIISGFLDYTTVSLLWSNVEFGHLLGLWWFISSKRAAKQWRTEVMPSGPNPDITVREVCFQEFPGGPPGRSGCSLWWRAQFATWKMDEHGEIVDWWLPIKNDGFSIVM